MNAHYFVFSHLPLIQLITCYFIFCILCKIYHISLTKCQLFSKNNVDLNSYIMVSFYRQTYRPMWTLEMLSAASRNRLTLAPILVPLQILIPVQIPNPIPITPSCLMPDEEIRAKKEEHRLWRNLSNCPLIPARWVVIFTVTLVTHITVS